MATGKLSDVAIRNAKPGPKVAKLSDGGGLQLWLSPTGGKHWNFAYRFAGKQKKLSIGEYGRPPAGISLEAARKHRDEAAARLREGIDPATHKRQVRAAGETKRANSFGIVAGKYLDKIRKERRAEITVAKTRWLLNDLAADLADMPVADIKPADVLRVLRPVEARGNLETARRLRSAIGRVLRFAVANAWAERDATTDLRGALTSPAVTNRAAITDAVKFGELLRKIYAWEQGSPLTVAALKLMALTALRPGEVRGATWGEIDLGKKVWRVPLERMKMRRLHETPLSTQAIAVLRELRGLTYVDDDSLVFPVQLLKGARRSDKRPLSENTTNKALRRLGFGSESMTSHGFRAVFATLANESGRWSADAIERQLAHVEANSVRRAYSRGAHWDERVKMMQWWADHLDTLRNGGQVLQFKGHPHERQSQ